MSSVDCEVRTPPSPPHPRSSHPPPPVMTSVSEDTNTTVEGEEHDQQGSTKMSSPPSPDSPRPIVVVETHSTESITSKTLEDNIDIGEDDASKKGTKELLASAQPPPPPPPIPMPTSSTPTEGASNKGVVTLESSSTSKMLSPMVPPPRHPRSSAGGLKHGTNTQQRPFSSSPSLPRDKKASSRSNIPVTTSPKKSESESRSRLQREMSRRRRAMTPTEYRFLEHLLVKGESVEIECAASVLANDELFFDHPLGVENDHEEQEDHGEDGLVLTPSPPQGEHVGKGGGKLNTTSIPALPLYSGTETEEEPSSTQNNDDKKEHRQTISMPVVSRSVLTRSASDGSQIFLKQSHLPTHTGNSETDQGNNLKKPSASKFKRSQSLESYNSSYTSTSTIGSNRRQSQLSLRRKRQSQQFGTLWKAHESGLALTPQGSKSSILYRHSNSNLSHFVIGGGEEERAKKSSFLAHLRSDSFLSNQSIGSAVVDDDEKVGDDNEKNVVVFAARPGYLRSMSSLGMMEPDETTLMDHLKSAAPIMKAGETSQGDDHDERNNGITHHHLAVTFKDGTKGDPNDFTQRRYKNDNEIVEAPPGAPVGSPFIQPSHIKPSPSILQRKSLSNNRPIILRRGISNSSNTSFSSVPSLHLARPVRSFSIGSGLSEVMIKGAASAMMLPTAVTLSNNNGIHNTKTGAFKLYAAPESGAGGVHPLLRNRSNLHLRSDSVLSTTSSINSILQSHHERLGSTTNRRSKEAFRSRSMLSDVSIPSLHLGLPLNSGSIVSDHNINNNSINLPSRENSMIIDSDEDVIRRERAKAAFRSSRKSTNEVSLRLSPTAEGSGELSESQRNLMSDAATNAALAAQKWVSEGTLAEPQDKQKNEKEKVKDNSEEPVWKAPKPVKPPKKLQQKRAGVQKAVLMRHASRNQDDGEGIEVTDVTEGSMGSSLQIDNIQDARNLHSVFQNSQTTTQGYDSSLGTTATYLSGPAPPPPPPPSNASQALRPNTLSSSKEVIGLPTIPTAPTATSNTNTSFTSSQHSRYNSNNSNVINGDSISVITASSFDEFGGGNGHWVNTAKSLFDSEKESSVDNEVGEVMEVMMGMRRRSASEDDASYLLCVDDDVLNTGMDLGPQAELHDLNQSSLGLVQSEETDENENASWDLNSDPGGVHPHHTTTTDNHPTAYPPATTTNTWTDLLPGTGSHHHLQATSIPFTILGTSANDIASHPHVLSPPLMESLQSFFPYTATEMNFWMKFSMVRDGASIHTLLQNVRGAKYTILALETVEGEVFGSFTSGPWRKNWGYFGNGESFLWKMRRARKMSDEDGEKDECSTIDRARMESELDVYPWTGRNNFIQLCTSHRIAVGGVGGCERMDSSMDSVNDMMNNETGKAALTPPSSMSATEGDDSTVGGFEAGFGLVIEAPDLLHGTSCASLTFGNPPLSNSHQDGSKFEIMNLEVWTLSPCFSEEEAEKLELGMLFLESGQI